MKRGVHILNRDSMFRAVRRELAERYGPETCGRVWENAGRILEELCESHAHLPGKMKVHTDGTMFRNAAVYLAIKEEHPEAALEILEWAVEKEGRRAAGLIGVLVRLPGMKGVFMAVISGMLDSFFGEGAGFAHTRYETGRDEIRFDIRRCPYCEILTEIGCPELIRLSCEVDRLMYGSLPGITFSRAGTLGSGAPCCDFRFKRERDVKRT